MNALLKTAATALAVLTFPAAVLADGPPDKLNAQPPVVWGASLVTKVKPGATIRWRSRRIGTVKDVSLVANGTEMFYELKPRTRACVGYAYGWGVAVRLTDCSNGCRVPYVRVTAVSAALKPVEIRLRFR